MSEEMNLRASLNPQLSTVGTVGVAMRIDLHSWQRLANAIAPATVGNPTDSSDLSEFIAEALRRHCEHIESKRGLTREAAIVARSHMPRREERSCLGVKTTREVGARTIGEVAPGILEPVFVETLKREGEKFPGNVAEQIALDRMRRSEADSKRTQLDCIAKFENKGPEYDRGRAETQQKLADARVGAEGDPDQDWGKYHNDGNYASMYGGLAHVTDAGLQTGRDGHFAFLTLRLSDFTWGNISRHLEALHGYGLFQNKVDLDIQARRIGTIIQSALNQFLSERLAKKP